MLLAGITGERRPEYRPDAGCHAAFIASLAGIGRAAATKLAVIVNALFYTSVGAMLWRETVKDRQPGPI